MRALIRFVFTLILLVIALAIGFYLGYRAATGHAPSIARAVIGTSGSRTAGDAETAIERRLAEAGSQATGFFSDAAISTKIKSKMGLDDHVEARDIHVSTNKGVVTLSGTVASHAERARAIALARDTKGVTEVVDKLTVR